MRRTGASSPAAGRGGGPLSDSVGVQGAAAGISCMPTVGNIRAASSQAGLRRTPSGPMHDCAISHLNRLQPHHAQTPDHRRPHVRNHPGLLRLAAARYALEPARSSCHGSPSAGNQRFASWLARTARRRSRLHPRRRDLQGRWVRVLRRPDLHRIGQWHLHLAALGRSHQGTRGSDHSRDQHASRRGPAAARRSAIGEPRRRIPPRRSGPAAP